MSDAENQGANRWDKRLVFGLMGVAIIAFTFWTSSRYPSLDEKASLGGDNDISALAFDRIVEVAQDDSVLWKIVGNALNWAYTNKQGMFFGILFAAAIMALLQLLANKQFKGRFANTLLGVSIGAPLGVCVNCAVPIAMGVDKSGGRSETTLAVLMSSPSLNLVVLSMTFALFPFWLASLKLGVTLAFIILAIPLAVKLFTEDDDAISQDDIDDVMDRTQKLDFGNNPTEDIYLSHDPLAQSKWFNAFFWYIKTYIQNLWYIFKITVPLMILAGVLGSIVVTFIPWHQLAAFVPSEGIAWVLGIFFVALLGTFFPVPIAFDVVICAVLLAAGVDPTYVAVLLLTLGLFSIYPALQIGHSMSKKLATGLFAMVALTGVGTGFVAHALDAIEINRQESEIKSGLSLDVDFQKLENPRLTLDQVDNSKLFATIGQHAIASGKRVRGGKKGLKIESWGFNDTTQLGSDTTSLMQRYYGSDFGLDISDDVSPMRFLEPFARTRSIATGDIHGDGWPDVVLSTDNGLAIFANISGQRFQTQAIANDGVDLRDVGRVLLADIDGDLDLDLIAGTFWDGVYILENQNGDFSKPARKLPGHVKNAIVTSLAAGDVDQDGQLEILIGNSSIGNNVSDRSTQYSQNLIARFKDGVWTSEALNGPEGETLSILIADLNRDKRPDVMIGNDYNPPDILYFGNKKGELIQANRGRIPEGTTKWTMSLATGDIDGDLVPEIYAGNISGRQSAKNRDPEAECQYESQPQKDSCIARLKVNTLSRSARRQGVATICDGLSDNYLKQGCVVTAMTQGVMRRGGSGPDVVGDLCKKIPESWPDFKKMCETRRETELTNLSREELAITQDSNKRSNVLLKLDDKKRKLIDVAEGTPLENGGWTWNARFADLDNDQDLDLYIVNGHSIANSRYDDKFFENENGRFSERAEATGLASGVPGLAYSYTDFDRDGDLDVITLPLQGPAKIYRNNAQDMGSNSIIFELRDAVSNSHAYGAEVTIRTASGAQIRELQMSGGFSSFDTPQLHFGLGDLDQIESVEILWPDGKKDQFKKPLTANAYYRITRQ